MTHPSFVAGDWGTTHLRLYLCDDRGAILDRADGPGVAAPGVVPFAEGFETMMKPWEARHGALPAVLCGMVGSSIGWVQAPYIACPALPAKIIDGCVPLRGGRVQIVPGVRCENRLRAPDFMRGEETQILGALTLDAALRRGVHLLCLPGTHTKWVVLKEGIIDDFLTAPTGELYAALRDHSVLVGSDYRNQVVTGGTAFEEGLRQFGQFPQVPVLHRLFECRGRLLGGELTAAGATAFLSGLLIAQDVGGALHLFADCLAERSVYLIGAPGLTGLYAAALEANSCDARQLDGTAASLAGLTRVHQHTFPQVETNAV
jgi:2-dehydro-3-deoxygalactonokinase